MKKQINKALSIILAVMLMFTVLSTNVFASDVTGDIDGITTWLSDIDNTGFDFSDTSYLDTDVCWTVFALSKAQAKNYSQYGDYINSVVSANYDSLFASNFALIYLTAVECGLDAQNIGGHDVIGALKSADYSAQTYLSSLYFPLIALDYNKTNGIDSVKQTIISTILAAQQTDGGFPYSTVDSGYGISSDTDTTSFVIQALSRYTNDSVVKSAVDKAFDYLETQKFADGAYGYTAWSSPSAESTSQAIIAKCMSGKDASGSITALESYLDASGAAKDYTGTANTMTSYQTLLALVEYQNTENGKAGVYEFVEELPTTTSPSTTAATLTTTVVPTTKTSVNIPKTGTKSVTGIAFSTLALAFGVTCLLKKKNDE